MAAITGKILMEMGKQLLKNMTKKAVKSTAKKAVKKAVKSVVKKKKVKGKDLAKKMLGGGEDKGGALIKSGSSSIIPSPAGKLSKTEAGGESVKSGSKGAAELGLTKFMDSLNSIQTSVESVKLALNDNKDSALERIEDQRLLNAKLKKQEREEELEAKKPKKKKGPLSGAKDVADNFLVKMARFAAMTLLGSLIAALMGGAKDVILAFRVGIEALKKGMPTLLKGVKALKAGIGKAFKLALRPFKALGNLVAKGFQAVGNKLLGMVKGAFAWVKNTMKNIVQAGAKAFPKIANAINQGKTFAGNVINRGKDFVKNTTRRAAVGAKRFIGRGARKFLKGGGSKLLKHGMKRGANRLIIKWFGKSGAKALLKVGKMLMKGAKAIRIPVIGPLLVAITSMFAGEPIGKTLFKTLGTAIGGSIGLALPLPVPGNPLSMMAGELIGEYIGNMLHILFKGGGIKAVGAQLKKDLLAVFNVGKNIAKWIGGGVGRFIENVVKTDPIPIKEGAGRRSIATKLAKFIGIYDWLAGLGMAGGKDGQIDKFPNFLNLLFPWKSLPLLAKSFFPPSEGGSAEMGSQAANTDAEDVSESASYEDGAEEDTTVVLDGGAEEGGASGGSSGGESRIIPLSVDKLTLVNSQYELQSTSALYKV